MTGISFLTGVALVKDGVNVSLTDLETSAPRVIEQIGLSVENMIDQVTEILVPETTTYGHEISLLDVAALVIEPLPLAHSPP